MQVVGPLHRHAPAKGYFFHLKKDRPAGRMMTPGDSALLASEKGRFPHVGIVSPGWGVFLWAIKVGLLNTAGRYITGFALVCIPPGREGSCRRPPPWRPEFTVAARRPKQRSFPTTIHTPPTMTSLSYSGDKGDIIARIPVWAKGRRLSELPAMKSVTC